MERPYKLISHTADLGIEVTGEDLKELFSNAGHAFIDVITDVGLVLPKQKEIIDVSAQDLEELMVKWLNEFLYLYDTKQLLFCEFVPLSLDSKTLKAQVRGEPFDASRHLVKHEIKAVTYHSLSVKKKDGVWQARIIFDI